MAILYILVFFLLSARLLDALFFTFTDVCFLVTIDFNLETFGFLFRLNLKLLLCLGLKNRINDTYPCVLLLFNLCFLEYMLHFTDCIVFLYCSKSLFIIVIIYLSILWIYGNFVIVKRTSLYFSSY